MQDENRASHSSRREFLKAGAIGVGITGLGATFVAERAAANPITAENTKSGDEGWVPTRAPGRSIEGYASKTSIIPGETVEFHVSTKPPQYYRIDIYRLGWYSGKGGRLVERLPEMQGTTYPQPEPVPETGKIECDWPVTNTFNAPKQLVTGTYLANFVLTTGPNSGESTAYPFFVRPRDKGRTAKILVQMPIATEQAYNDWGGKSLYGFNSTGEPADKVSYNRPNYPETTLGYATHCLRFLEAEGYDVAYVDDIDVHRDPSLLRNGHRLVISAGHDEYWSKAQRDGFEAAQDTGVNLVILGANTCYWQVRYEDNEQTMVGYKANVEDDPLYGTQRETDRFRDLPNPRPECELFGVMYDGADYSGKYPDYSVVETALDHPWMAGTGFEPGDTLTSLVGYEWDRIFQECDVPDLTRFFHYEKGTQASPSRESDADAVAYTADSGARVFSAGSLNFSWGLDPAPDAWGWPGTFYQGYSNEYEVSGDDPRLQQFMRNVLKDMTTGRPPWAGSGRGR